MPTFIRSRFRNPNRLVSDRIGDRSGDRGIFFFPIRLGENSAAAAEGEKWLVLRSLLWVFRRRLLLSFRPAEIGSSPM